jgi:hypothetical protein
LNKKEVGRKGKFGGSKRNKYFTWLSATLPDKPVPEKEAGTTGMISQ